MWIFAERSGCHQFLPPRWAVTGMAGAYSLSYAVGLFLSARRLRHRLDGRLDGRRLCRTYGKLTVSAVAAGVLGRLVAQACASPAPAAWAPAAALAAGGLTMVLMFLLLARALRISELRRLRLPGLT
ncbi:polysaccharide biosynthesis C-terminal domain-containing protein [Streptomyces silvensis]|uniref:Uncharacterized protein n=1 Tax=Streptomyces silvensis TaxID=1765722 RepID=A0A0W7X5C7_9ACTN|nr:polysaccharide biosynthesis C-terminal domain-containing protein [Streptomyces silvensis]KUF18089.1 hypothetical protein AT728_20945 [Streptomyces silvensis]